MRLPQDRVLHIDAELAGDKVRVVAEWQGELVRCKDCRHADECHKSVQYTRNEPNTVTIGYSPIEWCSHGERREPWQWKKPSNGWNH